MTSSAFGTIFSPVGTQNGQRGTLSSDQRRRLATLINAAGVPAAQKATGLSAESLARCCAGLPVNRATLMVAEAAIEKLPKPTTPLEKADPPVRWPDGLADWTEKNLSAEQIDALEALLAERGIVR